MKTKLFFLASLCALLLLCSCRDTNETRLSAGYDQAELLSLLPVMERVYDSADIGGYKTPEPSGFTRVFRSGVSPLMNRFDVWKSGDKTAVIGIRGTIADEEGRSFTAAFYSHMTAATGKIQLDGKKVFDYKLAEMPGASVHLGMLLALGFISDEMLQQIRKQYEEGVRDFIILGHSQGSGIGFLATAYIRYLQKDGKLPADFRLKTYCVAAPKVGNLNFVYDYEKMTSGAWSLSVNNVIDWVPCIGITFQAPADFPRVSPFYDIKGFLKSASYPAGEGFDKAYEGFNALNDSVSGGIRAVIRNNVYPRVQKFMPGYSEPELSATYDFERCGLLVPLFPGAEYYKLFPNDSAHFQVWENHSVYPYYILAGGRAGTNQK